MSLCETDNQFRKDSRKDALYRKAKKKPFPTSAVSFKMLIGAYGTREERISKRKLNLQSNSAMDPKF